MRRRGSGGAALLRLVATVLLAGGMATFTALPAQAAVIEGAVQSVTVTPPKPKASDNIRSLVTFCVPNGTDQGDHFTLTMPDHLTGFPRAFPIKDPSGALIARVTVTTGIPAVATFTMTDYVETHQNVCGNASFDSVFTESVQPGTTETLTYTENSDATFTDTVDVQPAVVVNRNNPHKYGNWADPNDQCRLTPADCIRWRIDSPGGPFDSAHFVDEANEGQIFSCPTVVVYLADVGATGAVTTKTDVTASSTVSCTTSKLDVVTGPAGPDQIMTVWYRSSAPTAAPIGGVLFVNTAQVSTTTDDVTTTDPVQASIRSGTAFGEGIGDNVTIVKTDTDGNDADTAEAAATLPDGTATLRFTVTNTGVDPLVDVVVTDTVVRGGTVSGLTCRFPDGASGTRWAGPFAVGASFSCTASLTGVTPGTVHEDVASVSGTGQATGRAVRASNPYHAVTPPAVPPPPSPPAAPAPVVTATPVALADTGAEPAPLVAAAVLMLLAGTAMLRLSRRRSRG